MKIGSDTVTRVRAALGAPGRYGAEQRDWSAAATTTISGVSVQPVAATEATVDREYTATHLNLFAPPGTDLLATDRVVWRGVTYEIDGEPATWYDLGGRADHLEAVLKRMAG